MKDLLNELAPVIDKDYLIGVQLGISIETLRKIEKDHRDDTDRRFLEMLLCWLQGNGEKVSWDSLVSALESPFIGHKTLAATLRKKYVVPKEITSTLTQGRPNFVTTAVIQGLECVTS